MYGSSMYGGGGMYGGGMYGGGYGGMGMGMNNMMNPNEPPPQAPPAWQRALQTLQTAVAAFSRVAFLVDENTQALHFFVESLLGLLDRAGTLYGELARFVLRLLGYKPKDPALPPPPNANVPRLGAPPGMGMPGMPGMPGVATAFGGVGGGGMEAAWNPQ